jgi:hypothetical protein
MQSRLSGWVVLGLAVLARLQADAATEPYRALLDQYCVGCHNQRTKTAGLKLDQVNLENISDASAVWDKVVRKLRNDAMPPPGMPQPNGNAKHAFIAWLEASIDRAALVHPNPGRTAVHRLNRAEYANAVRDLLSMEVDGAALLPPDDSGFGFDNNADVLSISPMLTERYLSAARKIGRVAVGDPAIRPVTESFAISKYVKQDDRAGEDLAFGSRGGLAVPYYFPVDGEYVVKIFLLRTYDGFVRGVAEPHPLEVRVNGEKIKQFSVGGVTSDVNGRPRKEVPDPEAEGQEIRFLAKAGPGVVAVNFVKEASVPEGMLRPIYAVNSYEYAGDVTALSGIGSIDIRGPYQVKGPGNSPSRQRIFVCHPATTQDEDGCARRILLGLARRAYRRPVTDEDLRPLGAFYHDARSKGTFDSGIEMALQRILVSPEFLLRIEKDPAKNTEGAPYRISDVELASRLSFFLWSSIPDDELLDAAEHGWLRQPGVLEQQVRRMLADPRSKEMVKNFTGQWLYVRNVRLVSPDPYTFPDFDANLREAFARELELFLDSQIREDHGAAELLTSDYTFVNERLARHYGIPDVLWQPFPARDGDR